MAKISKSKLKELDIIHGALVFRWSDSRFILFGGKLRINTQGVKRFYENWKICSSISEATPAPGGSKLLTEIWGRGFQQNLIKLSFMVFRSLRRCFVFLVKLYLARQTISFCKPPNFKNGINQFKKAPRLLQIFWVSNHTAKPRLQMIALQQA